MNINVEHNPNCQATIHVHASREEMAKQEDRVASQYAAQMKLPGYRPGKVPKAVVMKKHGTAVANEAQREIANVALQQAIKSEGLEILNVINVKDQAVHETDGSFTFAIEVSLTPRFELPEYKDIPVKLPRIEVNDGDVDHDLLHLRERYTSYADVERAAGNGDCTVLSFAGSVDGQPTAEAFPDVPVHLSKVDDQWFLLDTEEDFLPGFYAGLQGIQKGDARTLKIELPEDYAFEGLRGKTIELAVTCSGVKEKKVPELDAEFLKKIGGEEMTEETLRGEVKEAIRRRREQARDTSLGNQIIAHLFEKVQFDIPEEVVNRAAQKHTNDIAARALRQGMTNEQLMEHQDEILNTAMNQARQNVKVSFILEEIAKKEKVQVTEQQLSAVLANMASRSGKPVKKFISEAQRDGTVRAVADDLLMQNTLQLLKDSAAIEETDPESEHCETHNPAPAQA